MDSTGKASKALVDEVTNKQKLSSYLQNAGDTDANEETNKNKIFYFDVGDDLYIIHTGAKTGKDSADGDAGTDCTINDMKNATDSTALAAEASASDGKLSSADGKNDKDITSINMHKFTSRARRRGRY